MGRKIKDEIGGATPERGDMSQEKEDISGFATGRTPLIRQGRQPEKKPAGAKRGRKKKRKSMRQVFEYLLACPLGEEAAALGVKEGVSLSAGMTVNEAIAAIQVAKAMKGDAKAFELIRNTMGERRPEKGEVDIKSLPKVMIVRADGSVREV